MNPRRLTGDRSGLLARAAKTIRQGGIIAYPTESCYGFGCDPKNMRALKRLLKIKKRPASKGLILIAAATRQLEPYVVEFGKAVTDTWPGPVTWLVPAKKNVPFLVKGNHNNIAVRVTAHGLASHLCRAAGMAIVSTSANKSGMVTLKNYRQVQALFGDQLDFILPGRIGRLKKPTSIYDAETGQLIRQ